MIFALFILFLPPHTDNNQQRQATLDADEERYKHLMSAHVALSSFLVTWRLWMT